MTLLACTVASYACNLTLHRTYAGFYADEASRTKYNWREAQYKHIDAIMKFAGITQAKKVLSRPQFQDHFFGAQFYSVCRAKLLPGGSTP
jgi:hypothetical protein